LASLLDLSWTLEVVGDGPARNEVETDRWPARPIGVQYAGALDPPAVAAAPRSSRFLCLAGDPMKPSAWPLLEAQRGGVPVVAGASGGVAEIVVHGQTGLLVRREMSAFAGATRTLLCDGADASPYGQRGARTRGSSARRCRCCDALRDMIAALTTRAGA